jgi:hypothetical protein
MTTHARGHTRKGGRGRHRTRPGNSPETSPLARTDEEPADHPEVQARGPLPAPPDNQQPAPSDPSAGQETWYKALIYFAWRVSRDKKAQDGLCRLMRHLVAYVLLLALPLLGIPVLLYIFMPAARPIAAITTGSIIAAGSGVTLVLRKRRPRGLTTVGAAGPRGPEMAVQEGNGRLGGPESGCGEHGGHTDPYQHAQPAGSCRGGPRARRSRHHCGFHPVSDQRQSVASASRPDFSPVTI